MAAHQAASACKKFLVTRQDLRSSHSTDRDKGLTESEIQRVKSYLIQYLEEIARESSGLIRRRVVSTASVYLRRFYLTNSFTEYDPRCVAPACLFLACKAEESQVQAKLLVHLETKLQQNGRYPYLAPVDVRQTLDLELAVLEGLDCDLAVQSPAAWMMQQLKDGRLDSLGQTAWAVLNDSYLTEAYLLYTAQVIAAGCIAVAGSFRSCDIGACMRSMSEAVSMDDVFDVVGLLLAFYRHQREPLSHEECFRYLSMLK